MMQHVLFFLGNQKAILEFRAFRMEGDLAFGFCLCFSWVGLGGTLSEVIERLDELLGEEGFVLGEPAALRPKGSALDVLYLELDNFAGNGRDVDIEVRLHRLKLLCNDLFPILREK